MENFVWELFVKMLKERQDKKRWSQQQQQSQPASENVHLSFSWRFIAVDYYQFLEFACFLLHIFLTNIFLQLRLLLHSCIENSCRGLPWIEKLNDKTMILLLCNTILKKSHRTDREWWKLSEHINFYSFYNTPFLWTTCLIFLNE